MLTDRDTGKVTIQMERIQRVLVVQGIPNNLEQERVRPGREMYREPRGRFRDDLAVLKSTAH